MNKLRRFLPLVLLILVLAFFLYPSRDSAAVPGSSSVPEPTSEALSLVSGSPAQTSGTGSSSHGKNSSVKPSPSRVPSPEPSEELLPEDGSYTTKEDVSLYLVQYGHLPNNFVTKKEARAAGWEGGGLEKILPGKCIGGDYFGNYEGLLPKAKGRSWYECDINTLGKKSRGAERLLYSNDGLIYYTDDHYESYTQLY